MARSLLAFLLFVAACGGLPQTAAIEQTASTTSIESSTTTVVPVTTTTTGGLYYQGFTAEVLEDDLTLVAMAKADVAVYEDRSDTDPTRIVPATTILGTNTVLPIVDGPHAGWARVMLPIRPNGSEGWIRTDDLDLFVVAGRVVIDLSEKTLTYYRNDEALLESTVAIGTPRNPTPTGHFFVTDNVTMARENTPWGPHALGLSGRSDTITEYNGGDGIIGIHGTNRPDSIGRAASLGCVRLPNETITRLHELIPIGTPVEIRT